MERNFSRSLQLVLKSEGGFSNNKTDPGHETNLGITLANFRAYIKPDGTVDDLKRLTVEQAAVCYRKQYWDKVAGDALPDGVDYAVFDYSVNSGVGRAARYLQSVVGAPMDGVIGPATLAAVAKMPAGVVIDRLCDARLAFLQSLGTWGTFGKGWSARVASVRKEALLMTAQGMPQSQQNGAPPATGPGTSVLNNTPASSGQLSVPQVSVPSSKPTPSKPVAKHVGIGVGAFAIGAALAQWWSDISAWAHHLIHSIF